MTSSPLSTPDPAATTIALDHSHPLKPMGDYLVEAGLLSAAQVAVALNDQSMTGMRFGEILAARGWVKEKTIEFIFDKIIEPERRSLRRSLAWQKPPAPPANPRLANKTAAKTPAQHPSHRKDFAAHAASNPLVSAMAQVPAASADRFRSTAKNSALAKKAPAGTMPINSPASAELPRETCNGISPSDDFRKVSEDLVWIG